MKIGKVGLLCAALAWLGVFASPAMAEEPNPCADAVTTIAMRECLDKAYVRADADLNAVWKQIMAGVSGADYLPGKERKAWKDELLASQRVCIQFKENDCDAVG
ncbi:MAG TPA: lysozyme inhibitor LprI family protein [Methyloceanibacter sp.]|nr:lysozyme inhibitor LprI family protein [Methyloceanibacter sp.]